MPKAKPPQKHNQTPSKSVEKGKSSATGTGFFAIPAPELSGSQVRVIVVPQLTYAEATERGQLCIAFKWMVVLRCKVLILDLPKCLHGVGVIRNLLNYNTSTVASEFETELVRQPNSPLKNLKQGQKFFRGVERVAVDIQ